jgi:hypothetical protein
LAFADKRLEHRDGGIRVDRATNDDSERLSELVVTFKNLSTLPYLVWSNW